METLEVKLKKQKAIGSQTLNGFDYYLILNDKIYHTNPITTVLVEGGKLSYKNCQEIEFGYDLDELVLEFIGKDDGHPSTTDHSYCFKKGFKKAIEILGGKKFDELDITSAMNRVWNWCEMQEDEECSSMTELRDKHLKSLQQTEWDVEIEMVKEEYIWSPPGEGFEDQTYRGCREVPKLDADGCLILKKK